MTIGYLTNDLFSDYNRQVWQAVNEACRARGAKAVYFLGAALDSPLQGQAMRNRIYELAGGGAVDGILASTSSLLHFASPATIERFMARFEGIPLVTHGAAYGDHPAILVDNAAGVREEVIHVVRDHGLRRVAYISGPRRNPEAVERFEAFARTMGELGAAVDPDLVEEGDFSYPGGAEAFARLRSKAKPFEALVCASDSMACGAIAKAEEAGLRIPTDLAVVGFDDVASSRKLLVPLSTIRQPLSEQGKIAAETLIDWLECGRRPESRRLPTTFIQRRSCGCMPQEVRAAEERPPEGPEDRRADAVKAACDARVAEPGSRSPLDALEAAMVAEASSGSFDAPAWQNAVSEAARAALPGIAAEPGRFADAEVFLHQARILIQGISTNHLGYSLLQAEQRQAALRSVNMELAGCFESSVLFDVIWRRLPEIGVEGCYLVLYEGGPGSGRSRLMFGYNPSGKLEIPPEGILFETRDIVPPGSLGPGGLDGFIVDALFFADEPFGYVLMRANPHKVIINAIWKQMSVSLKGAFLMRELREKEKTLEGLLAAQKAHAEELESANKELEAFSYSVSHDLRAPLRAMGGFARILAEDFAPSLPDEAGRLLEKIKDNAAHMGRLVDGLLSFSRFSRQLISPSPIAMEGIVREVLESMRADIEGGGIEIGLGGLPDGLGDPVLIRQVWANLISNAVKFTRNRAGARIEIGCRESGGEKVYHVADNGVGFDMKYAHKLFGVFQRLHRAEDYEGTGIGLATVQRIVKRHGGRIWADAAVGRGATFYFTV